MFGASDSLPSGKSGQLQGDRWDPAVGLERTFDGARRVVPDALSAESTNASQRSTELYQRILLSWQDRTPQSAPAMPRKQKPLPMRLGSFPDSRRPRHPAFVLGLLAVSGPAHAQASRTESPTAVNSTVASDEPAGGEAASSPPAQSELHGASSATGAEPQPDASSSKDLSNMSLEELLNVKVVTASGKEEDRFMASATVRVVTREEIERRGYRSLSELLASVPGLYVVDDLVTTSVAVRGVSGGMSAGTRIVRVMIDGAQVNFRPDLNAFLGPEYIPMEAVERVEIALGPLSALHGANAFLATVNVITRTPKAGVSGETAVRVSRMKGRNGIGDSGLITARSGRSSLTAAFVLQHDDRSGLALQRTYPAQDPTSRMFALRSANDLARGKGGFVALGTGSEGLGSLSLSGGLQELDSMGEFRVNSLFTHDNRLVLRNYWSRAKWDSPCLGTVCAGASLGWAHGSHAPQTSLRLTDSQGFAFVPNYGYTALNGDAKVDWTPLKALSLRMGLDAERDDERILYYTQIFQESVGTMRAGDRSDIAMASGDRRKVVLTDVGAYLQASSTPLPERLPELHLTGNLRADVIKQADVDFPVQTSWRTAVAYRFSPAIAAKIVAGHAFQSPSAVLAFARPGFGTVGNIVGNESITPSLPPLKPQTVSSVEASANLKMFEVLALEGGVYYQELQHPIEFVRYGANYRAVNRNDTRRNVGVEGTLRFAKSRVSAYLSGSFQQTLLQGKLVSAPPEAFPNFFGVLGADLGVPETYLHANAELRWVSERGASRSNVWLNNERRYTLPAYGLVNVTLSTLGLHLLGDSTETRFAVGARNLFDARFSEPGYGGFDIPTLGRYLFAEARLIL
jgi:outer membrane receptor protein involved in Fe transport